MQTAAALTALAMAKVQMTQEPTVETLVLLVVLKLGIIPLVERGRAAVKVRVAAHNCQK